MGGRDDYSEPGLLSGMSVGVGDHHPDMRKQLRELLRMQVSILEVEPDVTEVKNVL